MPNFFTILPTVEAAGAAATLAASAWAVELRRFRRRPVESPRATPPR